MDRDFERIVATYADMLFKISMHYVKNPADAEDIVQQTFLKIIETDSCFSSPTHEKAWLIRVCANLCKDSLKHHSRKAQPLDGLEGTVEKDADSFYIVDQIRTLPPKQRLAVYLFYYENMSVAEIAATMEEKQNTVLSHLNRGRKRLKKMLKEDL